MRQAASLSGQTKLDAMYQKIHWRVLPFFLVGYLFAYLDRINIGFAKLQMQQDIGISDAAYGLAAGIFFLGYVLFEVPSNLMLPKVGARKTIGRIMVLWGVTSCAMLFVTNAYSFYALRFLLGVFEAGFAPAMIYYLTYWYTPSRRAQALTILWMTGPIGGLLGGPLSTWCITTFQGVHGLAGWQWMFLIEGLPSVLLGVIAVYFLVDRPSQAKWLTPEEHRLLAAVTEQPSASHGSFASVLKDPKVYAISFIYFCIMSGLYVISFWLPTILKEAGGGGTMQIGLYSAIPYLSTLVLMIFVARSSDRRLERKWHIAAPALVGAAALAVTASTAGNFTLTLVSISIAAAGIWTAFAIFWAIPSEYLKGAGAAGGIAFINSIGQFGGFVSPTFIGWTKTVTGSLSLGLGVIAVMVVVAAVGMLWLRLPPVGREERSALDQPASRNAFPQAVTSSSSLEH